MSISKNEIKKISSLQSKKGRSTHKLYIGEGIRFFEDAVFHQVLPEKGYYVPEILNSRSEKLLKKMKKAGIIFDTISEQAISKISSTENSQGIIGLFKLPQENQKKLIELKTRRILWCENISDPGNMGTLIRTALAFGFNTIFYSGSTADPYSPKVVRSTAGTILGVEIIKKQKSEILTYLKQTGTNLIAADINGERIDKLLIKNIKFDKLTLAIGSEANGLSEDILNEADIRVKIEHSEQVESLNAAIAGAILMSRLTEI